MRNYDLYSHSLAVACVSASLFAGCFSASAAPAAPDPVQKMPSLVPAMASHCTESQKRSQLFLKAGHRNYDRREYAKGVENYTRAINLNPRLALAYACRGSCHSGLGEHLIAIADYDAALKLVPTDSFILGLRGECKFELGDYHGALKDLTSARRIDPPYFFVAMRSAQVKERLGDASGALRDSQKAMDMCTSKNDERLLLVRASANFQLGNMQQALADFRSYILRELEITGLYW